MVSVNKKIPEVSLCDLIDEKLRVTWKMPRGRHRGSPKARKLIEVESNINTVFAFSFIDRFWRAWILDKKFRERKLIAKTSTLRELFEQVLSYTERGCKNV